MTRRRVKEPKNDLTSFMDVDRSRLGVHPRSRAGYARLLVQGWSDALRVTHPDQRINTFWHYMRQSFGRDAGLRLDHLLLSPVLALEYALPLRHFAAPKNSFGV